MRVPLAPRRARDCALGTRVAAHYIMCLHRLDTLAAQPHEMLIGSSFMTTGLLKTSTPSFEFFVVVLAVVFARFSIASERLLVPTVSVVSPVAHQLRESRHGNALAVPACAMRGAMHFTFGWRRCLSRDLGLFCASLIHREWSVGWCSRGVTAGNTVW